MKTKIAFKLSDKLNLKQYLLQDFTNKLRKKMSQKIQFLELERKVVNGKYIEIYKISFKNEFLRSSEKKKNIQF